MATQDEEVHRLAEDRREYKYGWTTDIEQEFAPPGLNEDTVRFISAKKNEPEWLLEWRLKALRLFTKMEMPTWPFLPYGYEKPDFQAISYYAAPKKGPKSLDEVDPRILETYAKLGIPLEEAKVLLGVEGAAATVAEAKAREAGAVGVGEMVGTGGRKIAVDAVFDSVSVKTTFQEELEKAGVIFCSVSEATHKHPELIKKYLGSVVPVADNY